MARFLFPKSWGMPEEATGSGAYWQSQGTDMEDESGTETDIPSDRGHREIDMSDLNGLSHGDASAHAYWQYRLHKRKWRRLSARLPANSEQLKGKGKVFPDMPWETKEMVEDSHSVMSKHSTRLLLTSVEKAKATEDIHTSGKGAGHRMNPTGRDGLVMTCRVCNAPEHFEARCPQSRNTSASPQLCTQAVDGPLADIHGHTNHGVTSCIQSLVPILFL